MRANSLLFTQPALTIIHAVTPLQRPRTWSTDMGFGRLSSPDAVGLGPDPSAALGGRGSEVPGLTHRFRSFEKLTSVHVDATDSLLLASGYSASVRIYDLETGKTMRDFEHIHDDHINISRFSYHSPFIFATSSFDRTVKLWDTRCQTRTGGGTGGSSTAPGGAEESGRPKPIYSLSSTQGHVMVSGGEWWPAMTTTRRWWWWPSPWSG